MSNLKPGKLDNKPAPHYSQSDLNSQTPQDTPLMGGKYQSNLHELNMPSMEDAWSQSELNNKMGDRRSESNFSMQKVSEEHVLKGDEIGKFF